MAEQCDRAATRVPGVGGLGCLLFRLAFIVAFLFLLWLESFFTETVHIVEGGTHIFKYNGVPWFFLGFMFALLLVFALIARSLLRDRGLAVICLLGIPLFALLSLQLLFERVEVSDQMLVHRREPPHTRFNLDIPWDSVQVATKVRHEKAGLFAPNFYNVGYEFRLRGGEFLELPSNTVLTSAQLEIDRVLESRKIPIGSRTISIPH